MESSGWSRRLLTQNNQFTNLHYVIDSTTPVVPVSFTTECSNGEISKDGDDGQEKGCFEFALADFWNSYAQWSAYGVGVPLKHDGDDNSLVQYYSPSLSALQIFTRESPPSSATRKTSSVKSVDSSDSLSEENVSIEGAASSTDDSIVKIEDLTLKDQQDGPGYLYCHFNELLSPYSRVPFLDKVNELAKEYPGLMTLKSIELSSHSWVAVAWYPIYRIPVCSLKELNAAFLTYHKLSSTSPCLERMIPDLHHETTNPEDKIAKCIGKMPEKGTGGDGRIETAVIPPFAMSSYKMYGDFWFNGNSNDLETAMSYQHNAWVWLKDHSFEHQDFNFFISHAVHRR